ncbi:hypothetical protein AAMO2058_000346200 [Amorphochlora amoebiformis]
MTTGSRWRLTGALMGLFVGYMGGGGMILRGGKFRNMRDLPENVLYPDKWVAPWDFNEPPPLANQSTIREIKFRIQDKVSKLMKNYTVSNPTETDLGKLLKQNPSDTYAYAMQNFSRVKNKIDNMEYRSCPPRKELLRSHPFYFLLGRRLSAFTPEVLEIIGIPIGSEPSQTRSFEGSHYRNYDEQGVSLCFEADGKGTMRLAMVTTYLHHSRFQKYTRPLPHNLTSAAIGPDIVKMFGEPDEKRGGRFPIIIVYKRWGFVINLIGQDWKDLENPIKSIGFFRPIVWGDGIVEEGGKGTFLSNLRQKLAIPPHVRERHARKLAEKLKEKFPWLYLNVSRKLLTPPDKYNKWHASQSKHIPEDSEISLGTESGEVSENILENTNAIPTAVEETSQALREVKRISSPYAPSIDPKLQRVQELIHQGNSEDAEEEIIRALEAGELSLEDLRAAKSHLRQRIKEDTKRVESASNINSEVLGSYNDLVTAMSRDPNPKHSTSNFDAEKDEKVEKLSKISLNATDGWIREKLHSRLRTREWDSSVSKQESEEEIRWY